MEVLPFAARASHRDPGAGSSRSFPQVMPRLRRFGANRAGVFRGMTVRVDMARTMPSEPGAKPGSAVSSALVATGGDNAIAPPWPLSSILGPLGALSTAPGLARRYIYVVLAGWDLSAMTTDAEIIVSELTTNVVMAATSPGGTPAYDDQGRLPVVW